MKKKPLVISGLLVAMSLLTAGCLQFSGGTWMFRSAKTPEGWPEPTPVGMVELRTYPVARSATVKRSEAERSEQGPMFMTLFRHIDRGEIAMTAPVTMEYSEDALGEVSMESMSFLYASTEIGVIGEQGAVVVSDLGPQTFLSVGMRGSYTTKRFERGVAMLEQWLRGDGSPWRAAGPARYLGYNSPFVLWFLRYGEVQIPVVPAEGSAESQPSAGM